MKPAFTLACCVALAALHVADSRFRYRMDYLENVANRPAQCRSSGRPTWRPARSGNYGCWQSNTGKDQWWSVKLDKVYRLDHLQLTSDRNAFETNIDGSELWIGNEGTFTKCADIPYVKTGCSRASVNTKWVNCPMDGNEVKITQPKETSGPVLKNIVVWVSMRKKFAKNYNETIDGVKYINAAFYRETSQSSGDERVCSSWSCCATSDRAVDGLYNQGKYCYAKDQISMTNGGENNWWLVKLDKVYTINYVTIWNYHSVVKHSGEVINSAIIWVGKAGKKFKKCAEITGFSDSSKQTKLFQCQKKLKGNTVKITLAKKAALGLTEVLVWVKAAEVEKKNKKNKKKKKKKKSGEN